jgi:predicted nucleotidyltransferase
MSPQIQSEIKKAVEILLRHGASEIFVFGSHAQDNATQFSDLDLAIRGMPPENFYRAVGEVCAALSVPADVVDLDESGPALDYLKAHGDFLRVA